MTSQKQSNNPLTILFFEKKCWQINDLADSLNVSLITVRRLLQQIGYFRSYTHNGRWYTTSSIPAFNSMGLWHHDDIYFSKYGSLTKTITTFLKRSDAGYSAKEIFELLKKTCDPVLTQMYKNSKIDRIKYGSQFVYLSIDKHVNMRQRKLHESNAKEVISRPISIEASFLVLVEFINHPGISFEQICVNLNNKFNICITPYEITRLFEQHGIKKKPMDSNC
jgi:hypothetical protein